MRCPLIQRADIGAAEGDHAADVFRLAGAAQGGDAADHLVNLFVVADAPASEVGSDGTGGHHVGADFASPQLFRQVTGQYLGGCFGGTVSRGARHGDARQPRTDVDDPAAVVQKRQGFLRQEIDPLKVDIDDFIEGCFAGFGDREYSAVPALLIR